MGISFRTLSGTLSLLVGLGVMRVAAAPFEPSAADPLPTLSSDEIVTRMVEKNLAPRPRPWRLSGNSSLPP